MHNEHGDERNSAASGGDETSATTASVLFDASGGAGRDAVTGEPPSTDSLAHTSSGTDAAALDAHAAAVNAGDVTDMTLEIENDVMKSHMELLHNGGMVLDSTDAASVDSSSNISSNSAFTSSHTGATGSDDASATHSLTDSAVTAGVAGVAPHAALPPPASARSSMTRSTTGPSRSSGASSTSASPSSSGSSVSAVYRWYDVEDGFHLKRKEESSIAKCKLCRQQGKVERKTFVRFSKSVTSNLWRHLKENHPDVYSKHACEKKSIQMHQLLGAKKRGRKKKLSGVDAATTTATTTAAANTNMNAAMALSGDSKLSPTADDGADGDVDADGDALEGRRATKKQKRSDQFFHDHPLASGLHHTTAASASGNITGSTPGALPTTRQSVSTTTGPTAGNFNPEKVREALGYLCLYEMLPFDVCSSHAFRSVMMECSGGSGGYLDESNSFAMFGKELACGYAKKLAAEAKARVAMQMKIADFAHLVATEWTPFASSSGSGSGTASYGAVKTGAVESTGLAGTASNQHDAGSSSGNAAPSRFLALFAVGLDQEFNAFRRCLHVAPIGRHAGVVAATPAALALDDDDVKQALARVAPSKYMPQVLALEPPSARLAPLCTTHKLASLESVASLLQSIMLATLYGVAVTQPFHLGSSILSGTSSSGGDESDDPHDCHDVAALHDRRLDCGEFIESAASAADEFYELPEAEAPTDVLEELPSQLTGHTLRDVVVKVLYLLAHLKQSRQSRKVLQRIALHDLGMTREVYDRVVVAALRDTAVSFSGVYDALSLIGEMKAPLTRYFDVHRDGLSDVSKLVQLAALSPYEWTRITHLKTIVKPFADATRKLEAERFVISSLIIPSIFTLLGKLRDAVRPAIHASGLYKKRGGSTGITSTNIGTNTGISDANSSSASAHSVSVVDELLLPEDIVALKDTAYANLSASFGYLFLAPEPDWPSAKRQTFNLLWSATLLDPRTRPFMIKGPLAQLEFWDVVKLEAATIAGTKVKDKEAANELGDAAIALDDDSAQLDGDDNDGDNGNDGDGDGDDSKSGDLWDDLEANLTSCAQEEMLLSAAKSSLELAKSSNLLEVEVSFFQDEAHIPLHANPLEWWQSLRIKYPFLARLARYVLSLPCAVKIEDNPVAADNGLVRRAGSEMSVRDLCDLLAASMNLRTERSSQFEASSKPMWSTV